MADQKSDGPQFDYTLSFRTRSGNEVSTTAFTESDKIMGIIFNSDKTDGEFCSWNIKTGYRILLGKTSGGGHDQDLVND